MAQLDSGSQSRTGQIEWAAPPSFHLSGMIIAVYVGVEASAIGLLSELLGMPIVGGARSGVPTAETTAASCEDAQMLIRSGVVREVYQLNSRDVKLRLKDGTLVVTTEPALDDVVRLIRECGAPCAEIPIAMEYVCGSAE
jgi:hypothetical protein